MIITKSFLNSVATDNNITEDSQASILLENKSYFSASSNISQNRTYDVFLSHSYLDKIQILALVKLFNRHGFSVYVDWLEDKQLNREDVTEQTADLLRKRMQQSRCLSYVTTKNITSSKWCPWELGYFDGLKRSKCCILPILNYGDKFHGQEYLGLYSYLEYASLPGIDNNITFYVCNKKRTKFIKLHDWLNNSEKYHEGILV